VGDQVWSYNQTTHKMELEPVQHVWINHDTDLVDLIIQPQTKVPEAPQKDTKAETLHTTRKHPFLTVERGFLPANALKPDMHVIEANGHLGVVTKWVVVPGQATMYNLMVATDHTYAVGVGQRVVHNCGVGDENPLKDVQYSSKVQWQKQTCHPVSSMLSRIL
jgi:hypothetical protein